MKLANPIVHQTQPTPVCCTATCIAMALGIPVAELGVRLDMAFGVDDFGVWLAERGVWVRQMPWSGRNGEPLRNGRLYLIKARSLNLVGSDHLLLLDTRQPPPPGAHEADDDHWICYDPNRGREGKKLYEHVTAWHAICMYELNERQGHLYVETRPAASPPP